MSIVSIETGGGGGYTAAVDSSGHLQTDVEDLQKIVNPVTTRPEIMSVATDTPNVGTSSSEIVGERVGRRWFEIQNLGDSTIHFILADSPTTATTAHRRLDPGEVFSWRNGVSYEGAIQAIAVGGSSNVVVMEFHAT